MDIAAAPQDDVHAVPIVPCTRSNAIVKRNLDAPELQKRGL